MSYRGDNYFDTGGVRWRQKRFRHFKGEKLSNETHGSDTDPDARLYRKGMTKEAKLCYQGHTLMENRNGLIVNTAVTQAIGTGEREAAKKMIQTLPRTSKRITPGALPWTEIPQHNGL